MLSRDSKLRAGLVAIGITIYAFVLAEVFVLPAVVLDPTVLTAPGDAARSSIVALLVLNFLGLAGGAATYLLATDRSVEWLDLEWPTLRDGALILAATIASIAMLLVIGVIATTLEVEPTENIVVEFIGDDPSMVLLLLGIVFLFNAPAEEFLFRNVVQKRLYTGFSRIGAVVVTSTIFALVHIPSFMLADGSVAAPASIAVPLVAVFSGSLIFGVAYERTDNLLVPIGVHALYNAIQFGELYIRLVGVSLPFGL